MCMCMSWIVRVCGAYVSQGVRVFLRCDFSGTCVCLCAYTSELMQKKKVCVCVLMRECVVFFSGSRNPPARLKSTLKPLHRSAPVT